MARLRGFGVPPHAAPDALRDCRSAGDAAVFFDPTLTPSAVQSLADHFGVATLTVADSQGATRTTVLSDPVTVAEDTALVVLTSGSTGEPKGVELGSDALDTAVAASLTRLVTGPVNTVIQALPTHHVAGLLGILRADRLGADLTTVTSADDLCGATGELVSLVPTQLARLVDRDVDLARLGTILLGGARASVDLLDQARAKGATIITSYGMSESCGGCVYDGTPIGTLSCQVDAPSGSPGVISLRGPQMFSGYRSGRTLAPRNSDDWFVTSDVGVLVDGQLTVLGRNDQTVVSGGENVPLLAVDAAMRAVAQVDDVFVFARDHDQWGHEVLAVAVTKMSESDLRDVLKTVLPHAWVPRQIRIVKDVPRTGLGKPDRLKALALFA